jgi:hypothetical protein
MLLLCVRVSMCECVFGCVCWRYCFPLFLCAGTQQEHQPSLILRPCVDMDVCVCVCMCVHVSECDLALYVPISALVRVNAHLRSVFRSHSTAHTHTHTHIHTHTLNLISVVGHTPRVGQEAITVGGATRRIPAAGRQAHRVTGTGTRRARLGWAAIRKNGAQPEIGETASGR